MLNNLTSLPERSQLSLSHWFLLYCTVKPGSPKQLSLHPDLVSVEQLEQLAEPQGKWCVVRYLGNIYPGIVTDSDDVDIVVKCMNSVGVNRFFWPQYRDDVC